MTYYNILKLKIVLYTLTLILFMIFLINSIISISEQYHSIDEDYDFSANNVITTQINPNEIYDEHPHIRLGHLNEMKNSHRSKNQDDSMFETSQHLRDYLKSPDRLIYFNFSKCRMSNCFDYNLCNSSGPIKVHIIQSDSDHGNHNNKSLGESNIIHNHILEIIRRSKHFEPDPSNACLFVLEDDTLDRDPLSPSFKQNLVDIFGARYNYGMNHLMFNLYSGSWPLYEADNFGGLSINAAILAKASHSVGHDRPNFDISLPLFSYLHPFNKSSLSERNNESYSDNNTDSSPDQNKSYFLTFKGKRYLAGSGSQTRNNLYHLNNQRDVLLLTTCRHGKNWREISDGRCLEDEEIYEQYDFDELMKDSTFCLVPRGRRLGSFRFLEALSYGCIPVLLSDGWIQPFDEIIDWSRATIQFDEEMLLLVPDTLRDLDKKTIRELSKNCRKIYEEYFSTVEQIIMTTLSIIETRVKSKLNSNSMN